MDREPRVPHFLRARSEAGVPHGVLGPSQGLRRPRMEPDQRLRETGAHRLWNGESACVGLAAIALRNPLGRHGLLGSVDHRLFVQPASVVLLKKKARTLDQPTNA
jgi:hypothetical protein